MSKTTRHSWKTIRSAIHSKILDSTYGPGDKLPKDEDIANDLGCARTTVQRAMQDLSDSGIIERRRKGGTHVRLDPITRVTLEIPVIRKEVEQRGAIYSYQLIQESVAKIPFSVAASFGLATQVRMLHVEAVHLADQRPYMYEDRWISLDTVPEISQIDLSKQNANEWLVSNKPYSRCDLRFFAKKATEKEALLLETNTGEALFVMARTTWSADAPITTVHAYSAPGYQMLTQIS